jgi:hypothetical protein
MLWFGVVSGEPFRLPLFDQTGRGGDADEVKISSVLDLDGILLRMIRCLPKRSKFNLNIDLVSRFGSGGVGDVSDYGNVGRYYVGIVAKMPLYSSIEIERSLKWESEIRLKISDLIGNIANNVVVMRTALRELGLYVALESRSKRRIRAGIAFTEEQVKYLEKVISARNRRNSAIASINVSRLELISLCRESKRSSVNSVLINMIERAINAVDK